MPDGLRFVRAQVRHLSLWQSAVAEHVHSLLGASGSPTATLATADHPLTTAVNDHVEATLAGSPPQEPPPGSGDVAAIRAYLSHTALGHAIALVDGDTERAERTAEEFRKFSDHDPGFLSCATTFAFYYAEHRGAFKYNDWTKEGGHDVNYGVIPWRLPNDAKVGIIGDWGTGLDDARRLLADLVDNHSPAAIIHLGDIYYSGTTTECRTNYTEVFDEVFQDRERVPVFTLFGNHDYYALGYPVYGTLENVNSAIAGAQQVASYFCLRTQDGGWQFLAMDTGLHDSNPADQVDPAYSGPRLQPSEVLWHQHKLQTFPGATVLLSHHQLFTAHGKLNGSLSPYADMPYLNPYLMEVFSPWFGDRIGAWLWGHEHNFVLYRDGTFGLAKGRLVGCSAYEEDTAADPYAIKYPQVQYVQPTDWQLEASGGYYDHGYAVIDLSGRAEPTAPIQIGYYEFPSWGTDPPQSPVSRLVHTEQIVQPSEAPPQPVDYGRPAALYAEEGLYVGALHVEMGRRCPTLTTELPGVSLLLEGGSGEVTHGSRVQIETTEAAAGSHDVLGGAWWTPTLYYDTPGHESQTWTIEKRDPSDPVVHFGDEVCFVNAAYAGQTLQPYWSRVLASIYLTTRSGDPYYWIMRAR
ncbi:MAG TPA: metallophosphoesterase [Thermoleophilaceae bacterium]|nr:metallophosphoesterase [Thermoleophilaceae bacterium]